MAKKKAKKKAPARKKRPAKAKKPARRAAAAKAKKTPPKKAASSKVRSAAAPKEPPLPWRQPLAGERYVGTVDDYYSHIGVMTLTLKAALSVGDQIHVRGHTTDIQQGVSSMQVNHAAVDKAGSGAGVGIKVEGKCRRGDYVYKVG